MLYVINITSGQGKIGSIGPPPFCILFFCFVFLYSPKAMVILEFLRLSVGVEHKSIYIVDSFTNAHLFT